MLLVNTRNASTVTFDVDLQAWLRSTSGNYRMTETDEDGKRLTTQTLGGKGKGDTGSIAPGELRVFEFIAE
jgi:hypothetical protein